jgi:hypothetical protein
MSSGFRHRGEEAAPRRPRGKERGGRGDGGRRESIRPLDVAPTRRLNPDATSMEIHLDKRAVRQIRLSAADAIEEGDTEALREDILEAFTEEQVEEIERRIDSGDFFEFLTDVLDEWSGDDVDELFELLETQLGDLGVDIKYEPREEEEEDAEDEGEDLDDEDDDDDDLDSEEEEEDEDV